MSQRMFGLLAVLVCILLLTGSAQAQLQSPDDGRNFTDPPRIAVPIGDDDDQGVIGEKIAGAWLGNPAFGFDTDCDGEADTPLGDPATDVQSFGAGGLYAAVNPGNPNSGLGTWTKTGNRQISGQDIVFINADPANPAAGLQFIARIWIVVDFDPGFKTASSTFGAVLYLPGQDPLDPNEVPVVCTAGQHTLLQKVNAK